jgi:hypothetical protein
MQVRINWSKRLAMKDGSRKNFIYDLDLEKISDNAGIYIFCRKFHKTTEALYVGKATRLHRRIKGQLNNLKLMSRLKKARVGGRFLLIGEIGSKSRKKIDSKLALLERALIRHFLSEGHGLFNIHGVNIKRHEIISQGHQPKKLIPQLIFLEKTKL